MSFLHLHHWIYEDKEFPTYRKCRCGLEQKRYKDDMCQMACAYDEYSQLYPCWGNWREFIK